MKRFIFSLILLPSLLWAGVGTQTFDFLLIPNGAKYAGIGGCSMGMLGDPFALFSNPAGIGAMKAPKFGLTYTQYIAGIQGGCGAYGTPLWNGVLGVGISYLNFGEDERLDENSNPIGGGVFTPQSLMPSIGYATIIGNSSVGLSLKIIYQTIEEYTSIGVAADAGFMFPVKAYPGLAIGCNIQNLGMQVVKFDKEKEPLPTFVRVGGTYSVFNGVARISAELSLPERSLIWGVEWKMSPMFTIRGGYYSLGNELKSGSSLDILGGLSFGLGFVRQKLSLDYALTPKVDLGLVNQISLLWTL